MTEPSWNPRLVSTRLTDGDARGAVTEVWKHVERPTRRYAAKFTKDPQTQEDLVQEAMIKLWELDPSRLDTGRHVDMFFARRALINRMWDVVRKEFLRRFPTGLPVGHAAPVDDRHPPTVAVPAPRPRLR